MDLVKLMCDLPAVVERAEDILFEVLMPFGPCSDPTQMGCAAGLDKGEGCLVLLVIKPWLPRSPSPSPQWAQDPQRFQC